MRAPDTGDQKNTGDNCNPTNNKRVTNDQASTKVAAVRTERKYLPSPIFFIGLTCQVPTVCRGAAKRDDMEGDGTGVGN